MDFLFAKSRNPLVFKDKEATKVAAIFERDLSRGEALTAFDEKASGGAADIEATENKYQSATGNKDQV